MDINEIKKIIKVMSGTDVTEVEVESKGVYYRVKRGHDGYSVPIHQVPHADVKHGAKSGAEKAEESKLSPAENAHIITSPMVGTFYRSPSPESAHFVEIGSIVKKGQVLCIIEAMKLMNEIESDADGKIVDILVENAHPVEFGEPLFKIELSK